MNLPIVIACDSFQNAWKEAVVKLSENNWELWNLVVQIQNPLICNEEFHQKYIIFSKLEKIKSPKDVAYTIFPHTFLNDVADSSELYDRYINTLFSRIKTSWGTYFYRMVNYETDKGKINQLKNIIDSINLKNKQTRNSFQIIIQYPGKETKKHMGGPCLNYITLQIETKSNQTLNMLAVYRNHDFFQKAYGNYWGLSNLLKFISDETHSLVGTLTCISSHAYVDMNKRNLLTFIPQL